MIDVVIIGAGLTGLTTALELKRKGIRLVIIEEKDRVGGQIHTIKKGDYTIESGPNTGAISHPEIAELFESLGDNLLEIANPSAKKRLILKGNKFHALPSSLMSAITTPLFTFGDKLRILGEPFRAKGNDPDESLADLTIRRMGRSFLDYAVDPFISGIYAGNPHRLITRYAMPKLYALEQNYGSFVGGAIKKAKEPKTPRDRKATKDVFSASGGLSSLTNAMAEQIGKENIKLSSTQVQIKKTETGYKVSYTQNGERFTIETTSVVSSAPAYRLKELMGSIAGNQLAAIESLRYAPVVQVSVGLKNQDPAKLMAFGGLIPSKEHRSILGILFPSSCFCGRAASEKALLSIFVGGVKKPDICKSSDTQIYELVQRELFDMLAVQLADIEMVEIFRHSAAIPQYDITQGERIEAIKTIEQNNKGLYLAGAISGGIGMGDRIKQGYEIANKIGLQIKA